jgi:hypothetical protein
MTFLLTSLFMFMVFWRPQEWLWPWMFGMPVLDVVVIMSLLSLMVEYNEGRIKMPWNTPQVYLLLGLWISAPLSHVLHTYVQGFMQSIFPVFKICLFSFLLFLVLDRPRRLRIASTLFVVMACTMAVHAHMQMTIGYGFAHQYPIYIPPIGDAPAHWRAQFFGIFGDANDLAQFLITCVPLSFILLPRRSPLSFLLGCGLSWYLISAMFLTGSRGGLLGLAAVVGVQIVVFLPLKWFPYLLIGGLLVALGLCPFVGFVLDTSAHDRVVFWGMANAQFKQPINTPFGMGYGMFWQVISGSKAAHNAFVKCYAELGVFGYWFWFGLIQLGIIGAHRARVALKKVKDPGAKWLFRFAGQTIVAMMGFCASAYFLSRTFVFPLFFLMAMLGVVPLIARRYLPPSYPPFFNVRIDVRIMLAVGTVLSITYIYISIILLNKAFYG